MRAMRKRALFSDDDGGRIAAHGQSGDDGAQEKRCGACEDQDRGTMPAGFGRLGGILGRHKGGGNGGRSRC